MRPRNVASSVSLFFVVGALGLSQPSIEGPLTYRFEEVKSKVLRVPGGDPKREEMKVATGDAADAGDVVRTGYWGHAVLSVPERACRFEVFPSARVRLAGGEPGVIVVLEAGRLEGFFEKFTGAAEERRVAAPGAILVVRGTKYGLELGSDGQSTLAVFEGTVEIVPAVPGARGLLVGPGEYGVFGPKTPPRKGAMARGADERSWRSRGTAALSGSAGMQQDQGTRAPKAVGPQGRGSPPATRGKN